MSMNFTMQNESFFITYDDVIKSSSFAVMREIITKYSEYYNDFIEFKSFDNINNTEMLLELIMKRENYSLFKSFFKREFNFDKAWNDIYGRNPKLVEDNVLLKFGYSILNIRRQKFVNKIYIWTREYDDRVCKDLDATYNLDNSFMYVVGPFERAIKYIDKPTCYVINNIEYLNMLMESDIINYSNILLADLNYNYNLSDIEAKEDRLKIAHIADFEAKYKFKTTLFKAF